jgi:signal transduction histidine kinase
MAPTDVNEILQRTAKLLQAELPPHISFELQLDRDLPRVQGDAEQLKQVFINLALNALEAMPDRGKLTLSTRVARDEAAVFHASFNRNDTVEIRFKDTGPGVSEEDRENIFVPFFTTKEKGTGLGLAICQRIVKAHQGSIRVLGGKEGAEFVIAIPGVREERASQPSEEAKPAASASAPPLQQTGRRKKKRRRA